MSGPADLYAERAMVVALLVALAQRQGCTVGVARDPAEPDWPVVLIDLPSGQVSWHFSEQDFQRCFPGGLDAYPGTWDGHDTETKYRRVLAEAGA